MVNESADRRSRSLSLSLSNASFEIFKIKARETKKETKGGGWKGRAGDGRAGKGRKKKKKS